MEEELLETEEQVVAEPETVIEGAEEQVVAELETIEETEPTRDTAAETAFAELRRRAEQLEIENRQKEEALRMYFNGADPVAEAFANAQGKTIEEVQAEMLEKEKVLNLERENKTLRRQAIHAEATAAMQKDLAIVQGLDPAIKKLEDLGSTFTNLIGGGIPAEDAYYAVKAKEQKETKKPPEEIGKINQEPVKKEFYTKEEVDKMSDEEMKKNFITIRRSMDKW